MTRFLKPRTVLCADAQRYRTAEVVQGGIRVERWAAKEALLPALQSELARRVSPEALARRRGDARCILYTATDEPTGALAGFYWAALAGQEPVWHDKFPIAPGTALLFNAYVMPRFRRRGVYARLIAAAHNHLLGQGLCERAFTVVEDQNVASMRANTGFGLRVCRRNYLIKVAGRTVFSVYFTSSGVEVHYVFRNAKSHRF